MADPDVKHDDYTEYQDVWQKCRDAYGGQRTIRKGRSLYLPELIGQTKTDYDKYLARANFFNATGRTVEAMNGLVFRKDMTVEIPESIKTWLDDITLADETLTDFAETSLTEVMTTGRGGIFVDMPRAADNITKAQAEAQQIRPYLVFYKTESIINWEMARVNNAYRLVNVWLSEYYKAEDGKQEVQIRQLRLTGGVYFQDIWQKGDGTNWAVKETIVPTSNGANITEIPFYPLSSRKPTMDVVAPPIEALVDVNIAHYQNSADLENGAHIAGQPTPYVTGFEEGYDANGNAVGSTLNIGSSTILTFANKDTTVGFLQCGSEGFATLEKLMDRKEGQMASLGANLLAPEKKGVEAARTHEIKSGNESGSLASTCGVVERQIEKALKFAAKWQGVTGEISVELNRDFFPPNFTGADLSAWVAARQAGEISKETLFNVLKYTEWLPEERTFEEEQDAIEQDGPTLGELTLEAKTPSANDNKDE